MVTEIVPYLLYSGDKKTVRCTVCHGTSGAGLGRHGIDAKSLKSHLASPSHATCWRNHLAREEARAADLEAFSAVSNSTAVSVFPDFEVPDLDYPPPIFAAAEPNDSVYSRVLSAEELAQELGADSEEPPAILTVEQKQSNLRQQYEQMLVDAYQADHLENEDGPDDQFVSDELPRSSRGGEGEEEEDEQCFDPSALPVSAYHPYPSKVVRIHHLSLFLAHENVQAMLLDIMDNFPRCRFTSTQLSLIIQFAKNLGVPDVPSIKGLRNIQQSLQSSCGTTPSRVESMQGNIFYMNDIRDTIARDLANPLVAPHLHFYLEETDGPISEVYQAERWAEYAPQQLTPMFTKGCRRFWINELAQLEDGTLVVPQLLVVRNNELEAEVFEVTQTADGRWRLHTEDTKTKKASEFERPYDELWRSSATGHGWTTHKFPKCLIPSECLWTTTRIYSLLWFRPGQTTSLAINQNSTTST
jgi:hypothetical protein